MSGELVPIAMFLSVTVIIVGLARIISDGRTRRLLVQSGVTPEQARAVLASPRRDPDLDGALKWALVTGSVGLALVLIQFLPYRGDQPITYGLVLVFGAAGLLGYFLLARRHA